MAFPLIPLLLLGGTVLVLRSRGGSRKAEPETGSAPSQPAAPVLGALGAGTPSPAASAWSSLPPKEQPKGADLEPSKTSGTCIVPQQNDLTKLPNEPFWDVFRYTLLMESDPAALEAFAKSCDAVCQPVAAKALRDKAATLKSAGVPDGYDPNAGKLPKLPDVSLPGLPAMIPIPLGYDPKVIGLPSLPSLPGDIYAPKPSLPFPVPSVETTPEPTPGTYVPPVAPGAENASPEIDPKKVPTSISVPKKGYRSSPDTQWWYGPLKPGQSPWSVATYVTGEGKRYPELMPANPEKATVGKPGQPGYTFASFKIGERIRVPKSWNKYIDQLGNATHTGYVWPVDPNEEVKI